MSSPERLRARMERVRRAPFPADPSASLLTLVRVPVRSSDFPVRWFRELRSEVPEKPLFSRVESGPDAARSAEFPVFSR
jgi:hypothetical protein